MCIRDRSKDTGALGALVGHNDNGGVLIETDVGAVVAAEMCIRDRNHDYASKAFMTSAVVSSMEGQNLISASLPRVR